MVELGQCLNFLKDSGLHRLKFLFMCSYFSLCYLGLLQSTDILIFFLVVMATNRNTGCNFNQREEQPEILFTGGLHEARIKRFWFDNMMITMN